MRVYVFYYTLLEINNALVIWHSKEVRSVY